MAIWRWQEGLGTEMHQNMGECDRTTSMMASCWASVPE